MIDLDALVKDAYELAPLPASVLRLLGLFADEDWSLDNVVEAASLDAPLTARILRVANSAAVGGARPVGTLSEAVVRIGAGAVVRIATGSAVRSCMLGAGVKKDEEDDLWRHSVATALSTELICLLTRERVPAEAFTAALLHDIGRVVLSRYVDADTWELVMRAVSEGSEVLLDAEREILGVDHAELGALIAAHWKLPRVIGDSIRFHLTPDEASDPSVRRICDAICVGDTVACAAGICGYEGSSDPEEHAASFDRLGLLAGSLDELGQLLNERLETALSEYE